ncbi:hypothetical protein [Paenibacillus sp. SN-8-1]|uniref:hypothetical protein n=1 Tax=Paenibacillus sp. SN-8-1 TaxID=3435409 RepID=UPI003D9A0F63
MKRIERYELDPALILCLGPRLKQRGERSDSGKASAVAFVPKFYSAEELFREFGDNSDWRNGSFAQRLSGRKGSYGE